MHGETVKFCSHCLLSWPCQGPLYPFTLLRVLFLVLKKSRKWGRLDM